LENLRDCAKVFGNFRNLVDKNTKKEYSMLIMKKKKSDRQVWDALIMVFQFGINMIVPIFLCTLAGAWIGERTGHTWIAVPLFFVGALAGFTNVYRMAKGMIGSGDKGKKDVKKSK
jgi:hypothetical protein